MSPLFIAALAIALAALLALLCFHLPDRWFCALLALACLMSSADCAYRGQTGWMVTFLITGFVLIGAAAHDLLRGPR
jgi:hypothetical protein